MRYLLDTNICVYFLKQNAKIVGQRPTAYAVTRSVTAKRRGLVGDYATDKPVE